MKPASDKIIDPEAAEGQTIFGVDTGGTFTDFVLFDRGEMRIHKVPSTPGRPDEATVRGIADLAPAHDYLLHYGTTVATNAFLERKGAGVTLLTTEGFEDVLQIGRQQRPRLYDPVVAPRIPLVPHERRIGVRERIDASGRVVTPLTDEEVERVAELVAGQNPDAVAVVFLFSFLNPDHERRMGKALQRLGVPLFLSSEVMPEFREYERTMVTVLNAYLSPLVGEHLDRLETRSGAPVRVMASGGGTVTARGAVRRPITTLLSGPAAGVVAAWRLGELTGERRLITFDMGGTSADVALIAGEPPVTVEAEIDGMPVRVPMIDIRTIGAGGGSIARLDAGGALKVGPESAGAVPGPICYGKGGTAPTVTDANLVLGRLHPAYFLGGRMQLAAESARRAMETFAAELNMSPEELAEGIIAVADTNMERVLRTITVERGFDPADFTLFAFGGAGGLHAAELASRLDVRRVMIPRHAGAISALGAALTDLVKDLTLSVLLNEQEALPEKLNAIADELISNGIAEFRAEGADVDGVVAERYLFIRYRGESFELEVPYGGNPAEALTEFDRLHERLYGFAGADLPKEVVTMRVRLRIARPRPSFPELPPDPDSVTAATLGRTEMLYRGERRTIRLVDWNKLGAGALLQEAALIVEETATVLLPPGWTGSIDTYGNLTMEKNDED